MSRFCFGVSRYERVSLNELEGGFRDLIAFDLEIDLPGVYVGRLRQSDGYKQTM